MMTKFGVFCILLLFLAFWGTWEAHTHAKLPYTLTHTALTHKTNSHTTLTYSYTHNTNSHTTLTHSYTQSTDTLIHTQH